MAFMEDQLNSTTSSLADANLIAVLNNVTLQIVRYCSIFIFIFGSVGNILNILVLAQPSFRSSPCALFFLFSSAANFVAILSGLLSRILSGWGADLTATNRFFCKLRGFVVNTARPIAVWYILFAMIDRWLLSSAKLHRRQMSCVKNACRVMIASLLISMVTFSHVIYCHEPNRVHSPQKCYGATQECQYATDTIFIVYTMVPLPLMALFGGLTVYNIRLSRNRIAHGGVSMITTATAELTVEQIRLKKRDRSLLVALLVQITILFLLSLPLCCDKIYSIIIDSRPELDLQYAISNLTYNIAQLLHFLSNGVPFYIYTLAGGNGFRKALIKMIGDAKRKIKIRRE